MQQGKLNAHHYTTLHLTCPQLHLLCPATKKVTAAQSSKQFPRPGQSVQTGHLGDIKPNTYAICYNVKE
jgi:hypothetical protein